MNSALEIFFCLVYFFCFFTVTIDYLGSNRGVHISLQVPDFWSIGHAKTKTKKCRSKPKYTSDRDTTKNVVFCYLLLKWHVQLPFLICFHQKFPQWGFYSLNVVLTSKIRCASKNNSSKTCSEECAESIGFY